MAASLSRMAAGPANVRVWIDVENPPQVQYLYPFVEAFRNRGAEVLLTARDYGNALELLRMRGGENTAILDSEARQYVSLCDVYTVVV